jgi:hypothetical protein
VKIERDMYSINRAIAIIKPKQPYIDWINSLESDEEPIKIEECQNDCTAVLLPDYDFIEEAENFIKDIYDEIFEIELYGWSTDETEWPQNRTYSLFAEWFCVEIHSEVFDPFEEDIEKER